MEYRGGNCGVKVMLREGGQGEVSEGCNVVRQVIILYFCRL